MRNFLLDALGRGLMLGAILCIVDAGCVWISGESLHGTTAPHRTADGSWLFLLGLVFAALSVWIAWHLSRKAR